MKFSNLVLPLVPIPSSQIKSYTTDDLREVFDEVDEDESGEVSKTEFRRALPELGLLISRHEADDLFDMAAGPPALSLESQGMGHSEPQEDCHEAEAVGPLALSFESPRMGLSAVQSHSILVKFEE